MTKTNYINASIYRGIDEAGLGGAYTKLGGVKGADDINFQNFNIGADYRLAKSTMIYGQYAMYRGDFTVANAKTDLQDDNVFSVGVRYDF